MQRISYRMIAKVEFVMSNLIQSTYRFYTKYANMKVF